MRPVGDRPVALITMRVCRHLPAPRSCPDAHLRPLPFCSQNPDLCTDLCTECNGTSWDGRDIEGGGRLRAVGLPRSMPRPETARDVRDARRMAHNPEVAGSNPAPATKVKGQFSNREPASCMWFVNGFANETGRDGVDDARHRRRPARPFAWSARRAGMPETWETRVVWLITQRSEVQIPPLPRPEALSRTEKRPSACGS